MRYLKIATWFFCSMLSISCDKDSSLGQTTKPSISEPAETEQPRQREDFYVGKALTKNNETLYLAMEKVSDDNRQFWYHYQDQSNKIAQTFRKIPRFSSKGRLADLKSGAIDKQGHYPQFVQKILGYDDRTYDALIDSIDSKSTHEWVDDDGDDFGSYGKLFGEVLGGLAGFTLRAPEGTETYIIYGSDKPILRPKKNTDYQPDRTFFENFGHIVISMSGIDHIGLPIVQHYGITKNVTSFFSPEDRKFPGVSMILHGFAAASWLKFFDDKKYMVTSPIGQMREILQRTLGEDAVYAGYPPQVQELSNRGLFTDHTMGIYGKTTAELEALSKLYKPAP